MLYIPLDCGTRKILLTPLRFTAFSFCLKEQLVVESYVFRKNLKALFIEIELAESGISF
jgi:hypothetical protein